MSTTYMYVGARIIPVALLVVSLFRIIIYLAVYSVPSLDRSSDGLKTSVSFRLAKKSYLNDTVDFYPWGKSGEKPVEIDRRTILVFVRNILLVYCPIYKNMNSQVLSLLYRYSCDHQFDLTRSDDLFSLWGSFYYSYYTGTNSRGLEVTNDTGKHEFDQPLLNASKFAIIRDPIDRFISGYLFSCHMFKFCEEPQLFNCGDDLFCLLHNLNELRINSNWPDFGQFAALDSLAPQLFFCNFRQQKSAYRLFLYNRSEEFKRNMRRFLSAQGIPKSLVYRGWGGDNSSAWLSTQSHHSTSNKPGLRQVRKKIVSDIVILNEIYRVYKIDYDFFHLKVPQLYKRQCKATVYRHLPMCQADQLIS